MSSNAADDPDERGGDGERDRYDGLNIGDEEFLIYDRENHQAWIQSSVTTRVDNLR